VPVTDRTSAIVLAAGAGTRMHSELPKPLHPLLGRAMVLHVLDALAVAGVDEVVVVVGHGAALVESEVRSGARPDLAVTFAVQPEQRGTGDAVAIGLAALGDPLEQGVEDVLVVPGDTPLLQARSIDELRRRHAEARAAATVLVARLPDPTGYGRVLAGRDGRVAGIVEQADASASELAIDLVNTSVYCFDRSLLAPALRRLAPTNAQGELYLTDVVGVLHDAGCTTLAVELDDPDDARGVNDRLQLASAESVLRRRVNEGWLRAGVTMEDPSTTYLESGVVLAPDVTLLAGTVLRGSCRVGGGASIGPNAVLVDTTIGERAVVGQVAATRAAVGADATISSFVTLRPGAVVAPGASVPPGAVLGS
jgi:bifunctional UDP-N-acetylglucosamine pyrophosphorylase/glucosamine-1-phosphate N-acetyltransferase